MHIKLSTSPSEHRRIKERERERERERDLWFGCGVKVFGSVVWISSRSSDQGPTKGLCFGCPQQLTRRC